MGLILRVLTRHHPGVEVCTSSAAFADIVYSTSVLEEVPGGHCHAMISFEARYLERCVSMEVACGYSESIILPLGSLHHPGAFLARHCQTAREKDEVSLRVVSNEVCRAW